MFADRAKIFVKSGRGGDGHVSFRREKYVPNGGPDGGDGGHGGSIIFEVDEGINTLTDFRHHKHYKAQGGEPGGKKNCRGKNGEDLIIKIPKGTILKDIESEKVILDMSGDTRRVVLLNGGKGGNGNQHYATSTMQAPKYAQPGQEAQELELLLELKVIADVGLIGFPNVGKSTFLSRVTNAKPKIANYHFTTIHPNLGVVDLGEGQGFVIADIPGLIEGASDGIGLGHEFLRHIERTKIMIHIVDGASVEGRNPIEDIYAIQKELDAYNPNIAKRPQIIVANKIDALYLAEEMEHPVDLLRKEFEPQGTEVFAMSAVSGEGVKEILYHIHKMLEELDEEPIIFEQEFVLDFSSDQSREPFEIYYDDEEDEYVVEGVRIEKMLGYTNLESEKGFTFFQRFLKDSGVLAELEKLGIQEGDTVRMYGLSFDYYK